MTRVMIVFGVVATSMMSACASDVPSRIYYEDFETLCDGVVCGWERTGGTEEQVAWVETIHEGEHGLSMRGEVAVRGPAAGDDDVAFTVAVPDMSLAVRCDLGAMLAITVVFEDTTGALLAVGVGAPEAALDAQWHNVSVGLTVTGFSGSASVGSVVIRKSGPGACEMDEILIDVLGS